MSTPEATVYNAVNQLANALKLAGVKFKIDKNIDEEMEDNNITITEKPSSGHELAIQIANEFSPRGQYLYRVNKYKEGTSTNIFSSNDPRLTAKAIKTVLGE